MSFRFELVAHVGRGIVVRPALMSKSALTRPPVFTCTMSAPDPVGALAAPAVLKTY
jgi:hypothetical protein